MAGTIKGMTIEIGGNTAPLEQALKSANKEINATQKELNQVNKLLKLDPTNVELLKQKQQLLGQQIGQTTTKLDALKQAQAKLDEEIKKGGNVNQEEYRKLGREIAVAESSLSKLKDEAKACHPELAKVQEALKKTAEVAGTIGKGVLDLTVNGVKALGTASIASAGAIFKLAQNAGALADDLNTLSATTGLSTQELQEFQYASDLIDVSVETLAGALKKTTTSMISAQSGTGASAEAFKKLGVSVTDAQGNLRDNNDVFQDAIKALGNVANETERDALAMQIFGKSATELNPLIEGGIDSLAEMATQANDLGLILSQEALDGANAFNDQLDILKANGRNTMQVIGTEIASELTPAMESLNQVTMSYIKQLTTAMKSKGIAGLAETAGSIIGDIASKIATELPKIAEVGVQIALNLVNAINENAETIGMAGAQLITVLVEGFYTMLPTLIETAVTMIGSFITTIGEKLPEIIPVITNGLIQTADAIVNNLDLIINAGLQLFLGLVQGLEKALPSLIAKLPEIIGKVATTLIENLPTIIEAVGQIVISVANTLGQSVDQLIPVVIQTILTLIDTIINNLPTIINTVVSVVTAIADALVDNIDLIIEGAVQLIVALAEGLVRALPKLVARLPEIIMAIVNGLIALASKMWDAATSLIASLGNSLANGVSGLLEGINAIWEYIKNGLTNAFKGVVDIGKNIVEGLWNGINDRVNWLGNKISNFCQNALQGIKDFFGIESPSKVMANQVGNYMAEGIGVGFGKTMPSVISQMQDKLAGVTDAFQSELTFGDIPQIQGNQVISENQYITRNYTNTIETIRQPQSVELVLDGTRVARTLIPALDSEYNRLGVKI